MDQAFRSFRISNFEFRIWACLLFLLWFATSLSAQTPRISLDPVLSGLSVPVYLTNAKDGTNRRFIVQQRDKSYCFKLGLFRLRCSSICRAAFSTAASGVYWGLAFHPQFSSNRRFFVNYTRRFDGATVIAEYRVSAANPNVADTTETVLLTIPQPYENHNGGMIELAG